MLLIALLCVPWVTQAQCDNGTSCNITIQMSDDYGDGWYDEDYNPFYIFVYQGDSLLEQATLASGSSGSLSVTVCSNDTVRFVFSGDDSYHEASFVILDGGNQTVASGVCSSYITGSVIAVIGNACPSCISPNNIMVNAADASAITFWWNGSSTAASYDFVILPASDTLDETTATIETVNDTSYVVTSLQDGIYNCYVRSNCGGGEYGVWVGPVPFVVGGCMIRVEGDDSYGDGWNGGYVSVLQGGAVMGTLDMLSGSNASSYFPVDDDTVVFMWNEGLYDGEVTVRIYDGSGAMVYSVTQPNAGIIYTMTNTCPSCFAPANVAVDSVNDNTIFLSWNAGADETEWIVTINDSAFVMYSTSVTITDLSASTLYTISVQSVCSSDDTSGAITVSTRTACGDITQLPFVEDFNSYASNSYPSCWYRIMSGSYPYITSSYGNSVMFAGTATVIAPLIQLLPSQMVVSFDLRKEGSSSGSMDFGYVTDPTDATTMVVLQNFDPTSTGNYFHYEVDLSLVPDLDTVTSPVYIAWRQNSTVTNWYYWLDNVLIEQVNDCTKPQNLSVNPSTTDSVVVRWDELGSASSWEVVYGPVGFLPDTVVENMILGNSDTTAVITTLTSGQTYQVYVRSDCGDGYSNWQGPVTFTPGSISMGVTGSQTIYACGAAIYDNGGVNGQYESGSNYTLTLYPSDDTKRFKFWGSGSTESCCDYLRIYAGASASGTLLAQIQGDGITIDTVLTQGGPITLYFYSDGSVVRDGFAIYVTCEDLPECRDIQSVSVVATTTSSAYVTWEMAVGTTPYPSSFVVTVTDSADNPVITTTVTEPFAMLTGMTPNSNYTVSVVPSCDGGDGASVFADFSTADFGCLEIDTSTAFFDTIINGTSTSSYIPSYSTYNYSLTQQIFTPAEIGHGGGITSIYFQPSSYSVPRTLEIYMGHCQQSTATSFLTPADLTMVYSGSSVSLTAGQWNEFPLTSTFNYNGSDNLIVIVRDMTGSWSSGNQWYGSSNGASGVSRYVYQDSGPYNIGTSGGTSSTFRSNIILAGSACSVQASCAAPYAMLETVDSSSATVNWIPGATETSWSIEYRIVGTETWTTAASGVSTTSYTLTGLNPSTEYEVRVVSGCTEDVYASTVSFVTECGAAVLPLTEDFQNLPYGVFNRYCWLEGTTNLGTSYPEPYVISLQGDENNKLCMFQDGGYMVLPKVAAPLNQLQVRFTFVQGGDSVRFLMGLLPNQTDPITNIVAVDTIIRSLIDSTSSTINYTYSFADLNPQYNGYNIAFWDAFGDNRSFIDNLVVEYIPSCVPVTGLAASNATTSSVDISWTSTNTTASYVVEYGPHNFVLGTGNTATTTTTGITLNGLSHSTNYDLYVYTVCSATDTSIASSQLQFSTLCDAVSTLPYSMDFENIMPNGSSATNILPNCWASVASSGTQPHIIWGSSATYYQSPTHSLYFYDEGVVALPAMSAPLNTLMVSFFDYNPDGEGMIIGAVDNTNAGFESTFVPIDTVVFNNGSNGAYQAVSYLGTYTGTGTHIAFKNYSNSGNSYATHYIDDVVVDVMPSCTPVRNLQVTGNTSNSITLDWGSYSLSDNAWVVSYSTTPLDNPMMGTTAATTSHPYVVNGLTSGTDYYFYVLNDCGSGDSSQWSMVGPIRPGEWIMRPNQVDTVYMCGGTIYDDGGANGVYSSSQNSVIIIKPSTPNNIISVSGTSYTESSWDYVTIYDGIGTNGTVLWTDDGVSANQTFGPFESTTGPITVEFISDGSVQYDGFAIDVTCVSTSCRVMGVNLDTTVAPSSSQLAITWAPVTDAQQYQIEYEAAGFELGQGQTMTTTNNNAVITGLSSMTMYDVYVRSICTGGDTGSWAHGAFATEMCDNPIIAYNYDTASAATTSTYSPMGTSFYNYGYVQTIIDATYLTELDGDINAMAFHPSTSNKGDYYNHITVYLANVTESELSAGFIHPDSSHVFVEVINDRDMRYDNDDWQTHGFDVPFTWDGQSNILVSIKRDHGSYSSGATFHAHTDTIARTRYIYQDGSAYDPTSVSGGSSSNTYGDIRFISCAAGCARPGALNATNINYNSATLNWTGAASNYEVAVKAATEGAWPAETPVSNAMSYNVTGLAAATQYQFRVRAICDAAEGLISEWVIGTFVTDSLPCFDPTDLHTTDLGYTTATLAWTAGTEQNQWSIRVWTPANGTDYEVTTNPATVTGLTPHTTYYAAVKAICGGGAAESEYSDTIQFTTESCVQVTGVTVSQITATSALINWNDAGAIRYEIEYGDQNFNQGTGSTITVNEGTSYTLTGLLPDYDYSVFVRAYCEENVEGAWSEQVDFTTPQGSGVLTVDGNMSLSIYPNPTSDATTIAISGVSGEVEITIVDMNGRTVMSETMSCEGDCTKRMEVSSLAQGAYFVRVNGEAINMVRKLIVK